MKRIAITAVIALAVALVTPALFAQEEHGEAGVYVDMTRLHHLGDTNFWGVGGRVAFNLNKYAQLEGNMAYDFERTFTSTAPGTSTLTFQRTGLRLLDGFFGPKIQTGIGPVKLFGFAKGGFLNFSTSNKGAASGFTGAISSVPSGDTNGAFLPGGGIEFFSHHIGLRAEVGDMMYFDNGANHNLVFNVGPQFRW